MDATSYRKIFRDIVVGKSEVKIDDTKFYIKHLSSLDQVDIDDIRSEYFEKALSRGIPKQEDLLSDLRKEGAWTDADEDAGVLSRNEQSIAMRATQKKRISEPVSMTDRG